MRAWNNDYDSIWEVARQKGYNLAEGEQEEAFHVLMRLMFLLTKFG